nr:hypothetical protein [Tanacetum cinerariifolium]
MADPKGYNQATQLNTCKLRKSLSGLKHANMQWFEKLTAFFISLRFKQSYVDTSLLTLNHNDSLIFLLVCVDDILIAGNNHSLVTTIKGHPNDKFNIKDLGLLHYYLGIEFLRNAKGLATIQRKYAIELVTHAGLLDTKPSAYSMDLTVKLTMDICDIILDPTIYRTLVGKLLYLTITRPDLSFQALILFLQQPSNLHIDALIKVIRYVKLSLTQEIKVNKGAWHDILKGLIDTGCGNNINSVIRRLILAASVYNIWQERNGRILKVVKRNSEEVFKCVEEVVKIRLTGLTVKDSSAVKIMENKWMISYKRANNASMQMGCLDLGFSPVVKCHNEAVYKPQSLIYS